MKTKQLIALAVAAGLFIVTGAASVISHKTAEKSKTGRRCFFGSSVCPWRIWPKQHFLCSRWLSERAVHLLGQHGAPWILSKSLSGPFGHLLYLIYSCAYRLLPTPEPFVKAHGKILAEG